MRRAAPYWHCPDASHMSEQQSALMSHGRPVSRQQRSPDVPGMSDVTQLPMQQSLSVSQAHCPVLHRLERAAVHPSFVTASAQALPPSPWNPLSDAEAPQLPVQQSLLSLQESPVLPQHA
jgi:hypothetical protein